MGMGSYHESEQQDHNDRKEHTGKDKTRELKEWLQGLKEQVK